MAFVADIVVLKTNFKEDMTWVCANMMNVVLAQTYGIKIKKEITFDQYLRESASKPVNRYLRMPLELFRKIVPGASPDDKEKGKGKGKDVKNVDVLYNRERNDSPKFANSRHFVVSFSSYEDYTIIWFNFHPSLEKYLPGFQNVHKTFARTASIKYNTEAIYIHTTSISRTDAGFVIYSSGSLRGSDTGKDALTVLKNDYVVDVNKCMDNVDNNIAIYYAPFDLATITKQIADQEARFKAFMDNSENLILTDKVTGENMVKSFVEDNDIIMKNLVMRKERVMEAMAVEGFGTLVFMELDREPVKVKADLEKEAFFGKKR